MKRLEPKRTERPVPAELEAPEGATQRARALRRRASVPEKKLWNVLRQLREKGLVFRRQHPIGPYIADFYCTAADLAVELDGRSHASAESRAHDAERDAWMISRGVVVLRFTVMEFEQQPEAVARTIHLAARSRVKREPPSPASAGEGV